MNRQKPFFLLHCAAALFVALAFSNCSRTAQSEVDRFNGMAYAYHYRDLDSTFAYAMRAYRLSSDYDAGRAEALNNLAFVSIARMDYKRAYELLNDAMDQTDNEIELLVSDVQHMRLCQRQSKNKNFYTYRERANTRIRRIEEEKAMLSERQQQRLVYAISEMAIVESTYFYYVGLEDQSVEALQRIDPNGPVVKDTAQLLNYYYNVGSGGIVREPSKLETGQTEFEYLMRCYLLSRQFDFPYWEANALQGLSEHLSDAELRTYLKANNPQEMNFVNDYHMPDSLLAGNLAQQSLQLFMGYGDVYQTAGAYRTLAECYWALGDYPSALFCLNSALQNNRAVESAPDLVASIREQLSLVFSAMDDKPQSDYNRNVYLDMQEKTRQDRQLEARAEQLGRSAGQLNIMIAAVVVMIVLVIGLLVLFDYLRRKNRQRYSMDDLMKPLEQWKLDNEREEQQAEEAFEKVEEQTRIVELQIDNNKRRNLELRAKVELVNSITPLINRMVNEVERLTSDQEPESVRQERYTYIAELTDQINAYNDVLTQWISMRQGELSLHIESFRLQELFDIVARSRMSFQMKGIDLVVEPTDAVVKADKTLTLFMVNTMADNARKFTGHGGRVTISGKQTADSVEISVSDTGCGLPEDELARVFTHKVAEESATAAGSPRRSHGFGLMNCKGIIEKYRKVSAIFKVCTINAESKSGAGSRFYFRLPKGLLRLWWLGLFALNGYGYASASPQLLQKAMAFADSAYTANVNGNYRDALACADSCRSMLNTLYRQLSPQDMDTLVAWGENAAQAAELDWLHQGLDIDCNVILHMRNESAIAALALHDWALYTYNNKVYTQLFRENSADSTLPDYVRMMQKSETNKNVAIIILILLLLSIFPAYYFLYDRQRRSYSRCMECITAINEVLLSNANPREKLDRITQTWDSKGSVSGLGNRLQPLTAIVEQIKEALSMSIEHDEERKGNMDLATDELRRAEMDNSKLHVSNSVMENCLSALKHETMYYPSRIRQLIDGTDSNLSALKEVVGYYRELYSILSAQATRQTEGIRRMDKDLLAYLFDLLRKISNSKTLRFEETETDKLYMTVEIALPSVLLTEKQRAELFTPLTCDLRYLLCRQIIREIGELTNARGCGIVAAEGSEGTIIKITLTKTIWKISKSLL